MRKEFILWFDQTDIDDISLVGGKNASLGEMHRNLTQKNIKKSISYKEKTSLKDINKFIKRVKQNKKKCLSFLKKKSQ